jgi:predicted signal transduction protein with EAL and GGDEF domain
MSDENDELASWQSRAEIAEAALNQVRAEATAKLVRAELKAEAIRAGMVDLDGLQLINLNEVRLTDAGEVKDAGEILAKMKRAKPWLFGAAGSSSPAVNAPRPEAPRLRHANELSHEEWQAARAALLRRR